MKTREESVISEPLDWTLPPRHSAGDRHAQVQPSTVKHLGEYSLSTYVSITQNWAELRLGRVVRDSQSQSEAYRLLGLVLNLDQGQGGGLPPDQ